MSKTRDIQETSNASLLNKVTFTQIFEQCVCETIPEEQIQRVLAPVLVMIEAGKFDRLRSSSIRNGRHSSTATARSYRRRLPREGYQSTRFA